jgi:AAA domain
MLGSTEVACLRLETGRMARKNRQINLPAPYLRKVWLDPSRVEDRKAYPYCLPFLSDEFELSFDKPITIIVGENGAGKSTFPGRPRRWATPGKSSARATTGAHQVSR